jgi:hypothetical protein
MKEAVDKAEIRQRIAGIEAGPWRERAAPAWAAIALAEVPPIMPVKSNTPLSLPVIFQGHKKNRQKRLLRLLAPHWKAVIEEQDARLRDAFDEALGMLSLYELAIETGYLPLESVRQRARDKLVRLLWSEGARHYVQTYDYFGVSFLAERLCIDIGFHSLKLPAIKHGSEIKFANFLSQRKIWYEPEFDLWLGLLDDYQILEDEEYDQKILAKFLSTNDRRVEDEETLWQIVRGADQFTMALAELYSSLGPDEVPRYGMFHIYWMARFFGYEFGRKGFKRDSDQYDWSKLLLSSARLKQYFHDMEAMQQGGLPAGRSSKGVLWSQYRSELGRRIEIIENFAAATKTFIADQNPSAGSGKKA